MTKCLFDKCCFCIDLRTGCLILAYLQLVAEVLLIVLGIVGVLGGAVVAAQGKDDEMKQGGIAVVAVSSLILLFVALFLAFTIVLLIGIHQTRRGHVKAYLIYAVIFNVLFIIFFFASFAFTINAGEVIKNIITILLNIYYILVIRSYYYLMDDKRPTVYNAA